MTYNVIRLIQGQARTLAWSFAREDWAETCCANLNRLAGDALTTYIVEAEETEKQPDLFERGGALSS